MLDTKLQTVALANDIYEYLGEQGFDVVLSHDSRGDYSVTLGKDGEYWTINISKSFAGK